ncbi:hypothetical protein K438DRAFT_2011183 [Mycena galopus ATCC 62051]|nr:hypothetical protein K438DRAFT_2011183 [Mycena galopus ATCC 62051]
MITLNADNKMPQPETAEILEPQVAAGTLNDEAALHPPPYTDLPANSDVPANFNSTITEEEWKEKLQKLEGKIRKYNWMKRGDETAIVKSMRDLAASHNDPQVQAYWTRRANEFEKAPDPDKKAILKDIGRGLGILIAAPFAIAGAVLIGTGMLLKAGGNFLTGSSSKFTRNKKSVTK